MPLYDFDLCQTSSEFDYLKPDKDDDDDLTYWMTIDKVMSLQNLEAQSQSQDSEVTRKDDAVDLSTTHRILGKALCMSFGSESGYETEGGPDEPEKWKLKPLEQWTSNEVLDWIFNQAVIHNFHLPSLKGEQFQHVDGLTLSRMTEEDFVAKDEVNGFLLYQCLQQQKRHDDFNPALNWTQKNPSQWSDSDVLDWIYYGSGLTEADLMCLKGETFQGISGQTLCSMSPGDFEQRDQRFGIILYRAFQSHCENFVRPNGGNQSQSVVGQHRLQRVPSSVFSSTPDLNGSYLPPDEVEPSKDRGPHAPSNRRRKNSTNPSQSSRTPKKEKPNKTTSTGATRQGQKRPRKPRSSSTEDLSDDEAGPRSKTPKQSSKTRLWKFMRDLLDDPDYNPECIRWEDKEEGIFRIVAGRSQVIAKLWGKIKNNPTMTFDKLGRSLRWCRANNGKFSAVPKDGKFPRKLCFRLLDPEADPPTTTTTATTTATTKVERSLSQTTLDLDLH